MADSLKILESLLQFPDQCQQVIWEMMQEQIPPHCSMAENIVVSGMGGSALGGRIVASLERQVLKVPLVVSTEYHLPNFVDSSSLVIACSYSGNTQETITCVGEARARNAQLFIITSGGKLAQIATQHQIPHYIYEPRHNPSNQPRIGLGYNIMSLICLLLRCQLIHPVPQLSSIKHHLQEHLKDLYQFQGIASSICGKVPVIVASEHLKGAAHAFKNQLNETAKTFAACFDLPELNHHLMEGLMFPKSNKKNLHFLMITSPHYNQQVQARYPITAEVIQKNGISLSWINISSPSRFLDTLQLVATGGMTSFYLSQLYDIDPGPVPWVDYFKDSLS